MEGTLGPDTLVPSTRMGEREHGMEKRKIVDTYNA